VANYKRFENETDDELIYRICSEKDQIGSWKETGKLLNDLLGNNYTESKYRKEFQSFQRMMAANQSKFSDSNAQLEEIQEQRRALEREKIKFRDERNAWNKQNYADARAEQKLDYLEEKLCEIGKINFEDITPPVINGENEMVICLSDLHIGQTFHSIFGEYNSDIAAERLKKYIGYIKDYAKMFNVKKAHIISLGDQISGSIHRSVQVTNRENVIEQIKLATELISSFIYECCKVFEIVQFYDVSGNHSRIQRKEDAIHDERLDDIIGWTVSLSLSHIENFHYMKHRNLDSGICDMNICGKTYIGVHGDYDSMTKNGVSNLSAMLGFFPDGIFRGHMHYPAFNELNGIKVIQSGSLPGAGDQHTVEMRLNGKPSQTICVMNRTGIIAHMPVTLL